MYLPIITALFLLPTLATIRNKPLFWLSLILSMLFFLVLILTTLGYYLQRKGKRNKFTTGALLLGYTGLFLFSTYWTGSITAFSPLIIFYNTIILVFWGYALAQYVSSSVKNLLLIASFSLISLVASLFFFPFSLVFLLNACLPIGSFVAEALKRKKNTSSSRISLQSMLAHEIRTPLTIMQTTTNLLLEEIPGPLNARQKQFVKSNYEYTQRLITFSENMLTLLKFEKEFDLKKKENINIRLITQDMVAFFGPLLQVKQQTIRYSFPALLNTPLGDESLIRQVFINLIHNAVKHTKEGGHIVISVTQDDEQMVVSISDNGKGVEGEGRENLFKEFYQEKVIDEQFQDGFGLGLSIARQIVQKHGGKVYITSVKDKGTIVSFTLPAKAIR